MAFKMKNMSYWKAKNQSPASGGPDSPIKQITISREDAYTEANMGKTDYDAHVAELNDPAQGYKDNKSHGGWEISGDGKSFRRTHNSKTGVATPNTAFEPFAAITDKTYTGPMLKQRWKQGNKNAGGNLNTLVKKRNTYTKGTQEYADAQNAINKSLGSKKVVTATVKSTRKDKKTSRKDARLSKKEQRITDRITRRKGKGKGTKRAERRLERVQSKKKKLF